MTGDTRVRGGAALVGLSALGATAAGFAGGLPEEARVVLVLLAGWVVPAFLCASLVRRFVSGPALAAAAFFVALSLHALVSEAFRLVGASFSTYAGALTWGLLALFGALAVIAWARRRDPWHPWRRPRALLLVSMGALVAIAAFSRGDFTVEEDAFDHIGYLRRVIDFDAMRPQGALAMPLDAEAALPPDPRKGALHATVAWIASLAGANPAVVWSLLPLLLYPVLVLSFAAFSRALLARRTTIVTCVALFMVSYGGTALQTAHAAASGQSLAAAWCWMLSALVLTASGSGRARLLAIALLTMGGVLAHVGVVVHALLLAVSVVLFARWLCFGYRRALTDATVLAAAAAVGAAIRLGASSPDANVIHSHVQGVLFVGRDGFVASPFEILRQQGMVFLGGLVLLPVLAILARRRPDARAVLALCMLPVCVAFVPPLATALFAQGSYMVFRGLLNAPVFAAAAVVLTATIAGARRRGVWARAATTTAVALWMLAFVRPAIDATRFDVGKRRAPMGEATQALIRYVELLPGNPVVLSDPATAYLLSAYCSHRFVALYEQHANPHDAYALDRLEAARDVLSPFADAQRAVDACRRFRVHYVVLNPNALSETPGFLTGWDAALFPAALARLGAVGGPFSEVWTARDFTLFQFRPGTTLEHRPDPVVAPVVVQSSTPPSCVVVAPERAFEVTGLTVTPSTVAAGEGVTITVGYRRDQATPFDLPFLAHVRFDHESLSAARAYPGDKYVRRFQDRRRGVTTRLRADFRPGAGVFEPDLWPMGAPLAERIGFVVPHNALPGRYQVEVRVLRDSLLPNFHARDLLFNRDHYSGTACGSLDVLPRNTE